MAGPFVRMAVQAAVMSIGIVSKAFVAAYQKAASNPNALKETAKKATSTMSVSEARKVLCLEDTALTKEAILEVFNKYYAANDPEKGGSLYLQAKIFNAKQALFEEMGIDEDDEDDSVEGEEGSGDGGATDGVSSEGGAAEAARETVESEDLRSERKRPPE
eukprot:TRINITY_DN88843_c0_g1_i1.p1 TRINITY_DN88843_c0_g1~~TRINITY_DN88843_c0_g1_i1.p1  ORF type:complete len:161 (+),score=38.07 TRINITY_DN88843_c0_g1_i1:112-594(+)